MSEEKKIELSKKNKSILQKDEKIINKIKETFDYVNNIVLIPHCFWGNINDPEIVILAKNPSLNYNDILDNKYYSKIFEENLKLENRDEIKNILFSNDATNGIPFELSGVSRYWRNVFGENLNVDNQNSFMNNICIINLCGYYKTSSGDIDEKLYWFYDEKEEICDTLKNCLTNKKLKKIFTLWTKNNNPWIKVLEKMEININSVDQAKKKNPCIPYFEKFDF